MRGIRRGIAGPTRGQRGTAALEFGLAIPFLLTVLMGAVELGFAIYEGMQVYVAAEAGALYAGQNGWSSAGISTAVTNATATTGLTATPAPTQFWGCPSEGGITTVASSSTKCGNGNSPGLYVQVNASLGHSTILPYPGLSLPTTFTATSVIRLN
ncbi:pilus assembly protein [Pseudolabrys taiwanensis]|uniref:Pilus assembly protein n=1 Tax=Pseudolabrys taiwanensis TaxID=331696 RepID=A0A346A175_9HYPH|nr:TadE family protein [Pseudolabrys taiwanensis]AXK82922.1 pilus assembly protein [Pseudolabrys taiwanensis]